MSSCRRYSRLFIPCRLDLQSPAARRMTTSAICGTSMVASKFFRGVSCTSTVGQRVRRRDVDSRRAGISAQRDTNHTVASRADRIAPTAQLHFDPAAWQANDLCRHRSRRRAAPSVEDRVAVLRLGVNRTHRHAAASTSLVHAADSRTSHHGLVHEPCHVIHRDGARWYTLAPFHAAAALSMTTIVDGRRACQECAQRWHVI